MSILLPAPFKAGNVRGVRAVGASFAIGAMSLFAGASASAADTAPDVFRKMADVYNKAKSFQATVVSQQSGKAPDGKSGSLTQTEHIEFLSPNRFHITIKLSGTGSMTTKQAAQQLANQQREIFCNGKTLFEYAPNQKMFVKRPAPPSVQIAGLVKLLQMVPPANTPGLVLLPTGGTAQGRSTFVIESKPPPQANMKPEDRAKYDAAIKQVKQFPRFMIDKRNYTLLQYTVLGNDKSLHIDVLDQVLGGSLSPNNFAFTPPASAKEYHPPTQGAPGLPGGPGGAPTPPGGLGGRPR